MASATADSLSPEARMFLDRGAAHHHIGGERTESASGATFETIDPATAEPIMPVAHGGPEDVDRAVAAARAAFEGAWAKVSPAKRTGMMLALADLLKANLAELAELESLDNGKPIKMAQVDVAAAVNHLRY